MNWHALFNWQSMAFTMLGVSMGGIAGIVIGLSLGFQLGTKRTIILFMRHFPTIHTMNELVKQLFKIASRLTDEKQRPSSPS